MNSNEIFQYWMQHTQVYLKKIYGKRFPVLTVDEEELIRKSCLFYREDYFIKKECPGTAEVDQNNETDSLKNQKTSEDFRANAVEVTSAFKINIRRNIYNSIVQIKKDQGLFPEDYDPEDFSILNTSKNPIKWGYFTEESLDKPVEAYNEDELATSSFPNKGVSEAKSGVVSRDVTELFDIGSAMKDVLSGEGEELPDTLPSSAFSGLFGQIQGFSVDGNTFKLKRSEKPEEEFPGIVFSHINYARGLTTDIINNKNVMEKLFNNIAVGVEKHIAIVSAVSEGKFSVNNSVGGDLSFHSKRGIKRLFKRDEKGNVIRDEKGKPTIVETEGIEELVENQVASAYTNKPDVPIIPLYLADTNLGGENQDSGRVAKSIKNLRVVKSEYDTVRESDGKQQVRTRYTVADRDSITINNNDLEYAKLNPYSTAIPISKVIEMYIDREISAISSGATRQLFDSIYDPKRLSIGIEGSGSIVKLPNGETSEQVSRAQYMYNLANEIGEEFEYSMFKAYDSIARGKQFTLDSHGSTFMPGKGDTADIVFKLTEGHMASRRLESGREFINDTSILDILKRYVDDTTYEGKSLKDKTLERFAEQEGWYPKKTKAIQQGEKLVELSKLKRDETTDGDGVVTLGNLIDTIDVHDYAVGGKGFFTNLIFKATDEELDTISKKYPHILPPSIIKGMKANTITSSSDALEKSSHKKVFDGFMKVLEANFNAVKSCTRPQIPSGAGILSLEELNKLKPNDMDRYKLAHRYYGDENEGFIKKFEEIAKEANVYYSTGGSEGGLKYPKAHANYTKRLVAHSRFQKTKMLVAGKVPDFHALHHELYAGDGGDNGIQNLTLVREDAHVLMSHIMQQMADLGELEDKRSGIKFHQKIINNGEFIDSEGKTTEISFKQKIMNIDENTTQIQIDAGEHFIDTSASPVSPMASQGSVTGMVLPFIQPSAKTITSSGFSLYPANIEFDENYTQDKITVIENEVEKKISVKSLFEISMSELWNKIDEFVDNDEEIHSKDSDYYPEAFGIKKPLAE